MLTLHRSAIRATALAVLLGSTILAAPSHAALSDAPPSSGPPSTSVTIDSSVHTTVQPDTNVPGAAMADQEVQKDARKMKRHKEFSPEKMKERVERRIKTLHEELNITKEQEPAWNDVAQAMRDNEVTISGLIKDRRANADKATAIENMNSYQKIAQAHADGLKKVSAALEKLYDDMGDAQKKNADKIFAKHPGMHPMKGKKAASK